MEFNARRIAINALTAHPTNQHAFEAEQIRHQLQNLLTIENRPSGIGDAVLEECLAYFLRYGFVVVAEPQAAAVNADDVVAKTADSLRRAPWTHATADEFALALHYLKSIALLTSDPPIAYANALGGILPRFGAGMFLVDHCELMSEECREFVRDAAATATRGITEFARFFRATDWSAKYQNDALVKAALDHCRKDDAIELTWVAYHGGTWMGLGDPDGFIVQALRERPKLRVRILIVDRDADERLREGATAEEHQATSDAALAVLLSPGRAADVQGRLSIRYYGHQLLDGCFRGTILFVNDQLRVASVVQWNYGVTRGVYGVSMSLDPSSSLAFLVARYTDDVYERSRPVGNWRQRWPETRRKYVQPVGCMLAAALAYLGVATLGHKLPASEPVVDQAKVLLHLTFGFFLARLPWRWLHSD